MQVDALKVELPPSQPVKEEYFQSFEKVKENIIKRLQLIPFPSATSEVEVAIR
ncbi:MAG: hypothetical protein U5K54_16950 [Cytophagales bacterium]|nr:hypothetical protein [Cytophagales bacterium]